MILNDSLCAAPPCSDEELSKQGRHQHPACAVEGSHKIGRAIRYDWPGPSEADKQPDCEIAKDVVDLPTERRAGLPIGGAQRNDRDQGYGVGAAKFCDVFDGQSVRSIIWTF
jgi:hypothetical protein